ncbi:MAG: hypothetical protein WDO24_29905 [Pseudomonadota bacterium]
MVILAAALVTISACAVLPDGNGADYYNGGNSPELRNDGRDGGDRDFRGGSEDHEHRDGL